MTIPLDSRQKMILERLQSEGVVRLRALQTEFGISAMTANRDAIQLVNAGMARRVRGGLALPAPPAEGRCAMCRGTVPERTRFILTGSPTQILACCPHCGFALILRENSRGALATDFLYGTILPAREAFYVAGSDVRLCCSPSLLSFAVAQDAHRFAVGFGGQELDFTAALHYMAAALERKLQD